MKTIALVLCSGGDFSMRDVELIVRHIQGKWKSSPRPRIICFWDKASRNYDLGNFEIVPLATEMKGTWSRIYLYSHEVEEYKPFLYIDLDTAVIESLENIFALVEGHQEQFVALEDFYQRGLMATGLVWFPKDDNRTKKVWHEFKGKTGNRMDYFLRTIFTKPPVYWQNLTNTILDFKPRGGSVLMDVPQGADLVCLHGKPRIFDIVKASVSIPWVKRYVDQTFQPVEDKPVRATVIIAYNKDRGWLQGAIDSVPDDVQLILNKGDFNWSTNFNVTLPQVKGKYIKYLHEDDMLTPNCIDDSIKAIEEQGVDFIHGNVFEFTQKTGQKKLWCPPEKIPTYKGMLIKNTMHSASMFYKKEIFDVLGGFNEALITSEDYEFNLRCLKKKFKVGYCDAPLAIYRRHNLQKVRLMSADYQNKIRRRIKREVVG